MAVATVALVCMLAPAAATAETYPPYDGTMSFPAINDPSGPEDFSWEVQLGEEEELRSIDDQHAAVYYTGDEHLALEITAGAAHDVDGTTVPTTLAVSAGNVITLTVHHRAGNPAAGGAPFDYPIVGGVGWEGGFQTFPGSVQEPVSDQPVEEPRCTVPDLRGRTLKASRKILRHAHCQLGEVRGERTPTAQVVKQFRHPGKVLPAGTEVGIKIA